MMKKGNENRPHIGLFGRRNNGKSSIINTLCGQDVAIVSNVAGTTTDPVRKSIEIHGIGPVIAIDTAGIDDKGHLGELRIQKSLSVIKQIDLAILVITDNRFDDHENELIDHFNKYGIPFIIVHNKNDLSGSTTLTRNKIKELTGEDLIDFSVTDPDSFINGLLDRISIKLPESSYTRRGLLGDLVGYGDVVMLITPIDIEAPEGRLILPQVQVIRDLLDNDCTAIILKEREVDGFLRNTAIKPKLVITDSQVFLKADASIPKDIPLTSFSIVLARQKGDFEAYIKGTPRIGELKDGDRILMLESCTHHVSCDDIGRVKIPRWITNYTGKSLEFDVVSGLDDLKRTITDYALVIQCGGCMITHRQLINRLREAKANNVPVSNYGMAIAYVHGIFDRAIEPFVGLLSSEKDIL